MSEGATGLAAYCEVAVPCGVSPEATEEACVVAEQAKLAADSGGPLCDQERTGFLECQARFEKCLAEGGGAPAFALSGNCGPVYSQMVDVCLKEAVFTSPPTSEEEEVVETERVLPAEGDTYCAFATDCVLAGGEELGTFASCQADVDAARLDPPECSAEYDVYVDCVTTTVACVHFSDGTTSFLSSPELCETEGVAHTACADAVQP